MSPLSVDIQKPIRISLLVGLLALLLFSPLPAFPQPPAPEGGLKEGVLALYRKDLSAAIRCFESLAEKGGPQKSAAFYYLGYAYYLNGRYPESRHSFRQGYEISPEEVRLLSEADAESKSQEGEISPLVPPKEKENPRFKKGARLLFGKDFSAAAQEFQAAAQDSPLHADFLYYLGYSLYEMKKFEEARNAFLEAYRVQPDYLPPLPSQGP